MKIDPNASMWLNIAVSVVAALTGATAMFTDLFGQGPAQKIAAGLGLAGIVLGGVNTALHAYSSPAPGPMVAKP